jgi:glycosyltransferase involved in cell wall biosynthesis
MSLPKISVVVPSFNQARFIQDTLLSVIKQNYPDLELIVIDGGSTDGSVEIIKKFSPFINYWVSEPDGGQTNGLIKGFNRSTGDIWCWLNSDDLHTPSTLFEVAQFFQKNHDADAVFGDALWIDENGKPLREQREISFNRFLWLYTYNYIPGMSMFWRKQLYKESGGLNPKYDLAMDADLWIRFADIGRIKHVRSIWSHMRFYPEQKNCRLREKSDAEDLMIRSRYWRAQQPSLYRTKLFFAKVIRVAWKFGTGCYPLGYQRFLGKP